jgi:hypothetical protein
METKALIYFVGRQIPLLGEIVLADARMSSLLTSRQSFEILHAL